MMSDMAAVLPLTQANLTKNREALDIPALCVPLLWHADSKVVQEHLQAQALPHCMTPVQLVIGSDLLYRPDDGGGIGSADVSNVSQQAALLGTLSAFLRPGSGTVGLIALVEHVEGLVDAFIQNAESCGIVAATLEDYCSADDSRGDRDSDREALRSALSDANETEPPTILLRLVRV